MNFPAYPTAASRSKPGISVAICFPTLSGRVGVIVVVAISCSLLDLPFHYGNQVEAHQQRHNERKRDGVDVEREPGSGWSGVRFWHYSFSGNIFVTYAVT